MDKYADSTLADPGVAGIYTHSDITDLEGLEKIKDAVDLTLLCNKVCFKDYRQPISDMEADCHGKCFDNLYAGLLFTQNKFFKEINRKN